jgi:hypothetical protein
MHSMSITDPGSPAVGAPAEYRALTHHLTM